jgi:H+/Cl- antiporter ClcA
MPVGAADATQGLISTIVPMMELTGRDRSFILPMLVAVTAATLVARGGRHGSPRRPGDA